MSEPTQTLRILSVEIRSEEDVVGARQRARQIAEALGFAVPAQTAIATSLSEIARNAYQYAGGGRIEFSVVTDPHPGEVRRAPQILLIEVRDKGPGIAQLETILGGRYRSSTGMGIGIIGTKKLMDRVDIETSAKGTTIVMRKALPRGATVLNPAQLKTVVEKLTAQRPLSALEEVQVQNRELMHAMDEAQERQDELTRVNQELAETNTGVLALYDELETLHRISLMLASKLDLKALIQSIVDVTTSLTDAEVGAFYSREEGAKGWLLYASSGARAEVLDHIPRNQAPEFFGSEFATEGIVHIPDVAEHAEECSSSRFSEVVAPWMAVRSCLTVPVVDAEATLLGALIFASSKPKAFNERCERILVSVASQAAVGIEKARLFQTVSAASAAKDDFLAMLSHELRTPLNPVMAVVSSLYGDSRVPLELREDIAVIWRNIRLEARLIDDLLDFNRLIKGKLELSQEALDAHALIESVIEICREDLEAKNQILTANLHAKRTTVKGDAARLQQVLWNVLKNAIKFTPAGGSISIVTTEADEMLKIEVIDTGRGIEPDALEGIFTAFDQGQKQVASHFGGLGLGLSIARMFVNLHGGKIRAFSEGLGHGATITIEVPLVDVAPEARSEALPKAQSAGAKQGARILLIDDHVDTLNTLARLLRRNGYEVVTAASGEEAREIAAREVFDLYISDLGLPDCSGHELLRALRERKDAPAIALSGYGMESDVTSSREAGFQEHLTKPIDFGQLSQTVAGLLAR